MNSMLKIEWLFKSCSIRMNQCALKIKIKNRVNIWYMYTQKVYLSYMLVRAQLKMFLMGWDKELLFQSICMQEKC